MVWHAGATAAVECSLCEAGTYWTGSGPRLSFFTSIFARREIAFSNMSHDVPPPAVRFMRHMLFRQPMIPDTWHGVQVQGQLMFAAYARQGRT
jgi:hypothetical protein